MSFHFLAAAAPVFLILISSHSMLVSIYSCIQAYHLTKTFSPFYLGRFCYYSFRRPTMRYYMWWLPALDVDDDDDRVKKVKTIASSSSPPRPLNFFKLSRRYRVEVAHVFSFKNSMRVSKYVSDKAVKQELGSWGRQGNRKKHRREKKTRFVLCKKNWNTNKTVNIFKKEGGSRSKVIKRVKCFV